MTKKKDLQSTYKARNIMVLTLNSPTTAPSSVSFMEIVGKRLSERSKF
jgi:hypothetical protein